MKLYPGRFLSITTVLAALQFNVQNALGEKKNTHKENRPTMYTFFEHQNDLGGSARQGEQLITTWKNLWFDAGWEPKVLTMEDAMKHPKYEQYTQEIKQDEFSVIRDQSFDYMCLMRWLAMAAQGTGGWMSDYDTMPMGLGPNHGRYLPNAGAFTDHDGFVPSLLSGNVEEWNRMSQNVLEISIEKIKNNKDDNFFYSDMFAMYDIHERSPMDYIQQQSVYKGVPYTAPDVVDCNAIEGSFAVHLSHARTHKAMEDGLVNFPKNISIDLAVGRSRPGLARRMYHNWKRQCLTRTASERN